MMVLSSLFSIFTGSVQYNFVDAQKFELNAKVFLDRTSYGPGSIVYVSILDRNFNLDNDVVESIDLTQIVEGDPIVEVRVVQPTQGTFTLSALDGSMKDRNGRSVTEAVESGPDTSLFDFEIQLPDDIEVNSSIGVLYNDPFELSPTTREDISVEQKITVTDTRFTDNSGKVLQKGIVGQQVTISSIIQNHMSSKQEYLYIVQVKDSDGFTVSLSWISGNIEQQRAASVAVPWVPDKTGQYTIEIFVWQSLLKPVPLLLKEVKNVITVS
jgi:hypothetical protein